MSQKSIDVELLEAIENFVDAKSALDWAVQQKPYNHGIVEAAKKIVAEKREELHRHILALTWVASAR